MTTRLQAHPWHGIPVGTDAPAVVNAFIEIVLLPHLHGPDASGPRRCEISDVYGTAGAHAVIRAAIADYAAGFPSAR